VPTPPSLTPSFMVTPDTGGMGRSTIPRYLPPMPSIHPKDSCPGGCFLGGFADRNGWGRTSAMIASAACGRANEKVPKGKATLNSTKVTVNVTGGLLAVVATSRNTKNVSLSIHRIWWTSGSPGSALGEGQCALPRSRTYARRPATVERQLALLADCLTGESYPAAAVASSLIGSGPLPVVTFGACGRTPSGSACHGGALQSLSSINASHPTLPTSRRPSP